MILNIKAWEDWEKAYQSKEPVDFARNLRLLDAMYEEAKALKIFPLSDPLEGLDAKIQMVKAIHSCR
jgi:hypothetical protein